MSRNKKLVTIVALVVAIIGLGIGFAAFATNLKVDSGAKVTPSASAFKVKFSGTTLNCNTKTGSGAATATGTIGTDGLSITGLAVTLTKPGDSVTCTGTITAEGDYTAYLTGITTSKLTCSAASGTFGSLGSAACSSIKATFSVGTAVATATTASSSNAATLGESLKLTKTGTTFNSHTLTVKIEYLSSGKATDEAMNITIPKTTLVYQTVKGATK